MKKTIIIEISVKAFNETNAIENSIANKKLNEIINNITESIKNIDTSGVFFDININTK